MGEKDHKIRRLIKSSVITDSSHHNSSIKLYKFISFRTLYAPAIDKILNLDSLSDEIRIFSFSLKQERVIRPKKHTDKSDLIILSFTWSDRQERIGAVLKDFTISFWDAHDNFNFEKNFNISNFTAEYQTNIWYICFFNTWLTTDRNNILYEWDIENETLSRKHKSDKINATIIDVSEVAHLKIIAVASLDKKVTLWNLEKSMIILEIDMTQGGVHTIKYFHSYQILIIAGYQNSIPLYWIHPHYFDFTQIGKLIGHSSMVTAVDITEGTPMIISSDDAGNIKMWDVRNLKCIQSLSIGTRTVFQQLISITQWDCIALVGSRVNMMFFDEPLANKNNEENSLFPLKLEYNYVSEDLFVCTRKDIRVVSLLDGRIKRVMRGLLENTDDELTAFRFFEQNRKFIVGDHKGNLRIYLTESGELLKKLRPHKNEVTTIFVDFVNKLFISCGCDGLLLIQRETKMARGINKIEMVKKVDTLLDDYYKKYLKNSLAKNKTLENNDEKEEKEVKNYKGYEVKRTLKNCFDGHEITILEVSIYHNLIITCSLVNKIYLWDYEFCRILSVIILNEGEEPTAVNIINGPCIIIVFTNQKRILYFTLNDDQRNMKFLGEFFIEESVSKVVSDINEALLVSGTNKGRIDLYSLENILKLCPKIPTASKRTNYNPLRFEKKSFQSELTRGKVPEIYTSGKVENGILIQNTQSSSFIPPIVTLVIKGHKDSITSLMFVEMNVFCVVSTSLDGYIRFWDCKYGQLVASFSTNHPLPIKWNIFPDKTKKLKRNIMFALKIIDLIGKRHRKDISPSEASYLNLNIFLTSIAKEGSQSIIKEKNQLKLPIQETEQTVTILREEYSPRDLQFNRVKDLYERELKGPALKEMEATKRVHAAHKAWKAAVEASSIEESNLQKQYQSMMDNIREYESLAFFDPDYKEKILSNLLKEGIYTESVNKFGKKLEVYLRKKKFEGYELTKNIVSYEKKSFLPNFENSNLNTEEKTQIENRIGNFYSYAESKNLYLNNTIETISNNNKNRNGLNKIMKNLDKKVKHSQFNRNSFDFGDPFSLSQTASVDTLKKSTFRLPAIKNYKSNDRKKNKKEKEKLFERVLDNDAIKLETDKFVEDIEINIDEILQRVKVKTQQKLQNELSELISERQAELRRKIQAQFKKTIDKEKEEKEEKADNFISLQKVFSSLNTQM